MFRAFAGAGGPGGAAATNSPPPVTPATTTNGNQNGKDTSSLFFNQFENNLRSWHSTNYCLPSPTSPPPPLVLPRSVDQHLHHGFVDCVQPQPCLAENTATTTTIGRGHSQALGHYDNVRMMMSATTIGRTKATNQNRSNGNLFNK